MAIVRIDEKTLAQKIKRAVLGSIKPNWMTRISVLIGFFVWLYFVVWQAFIFTSILLVNQFKNPELIKTTFAKIGGKYNFNIKYAQFNWNTMDVMFYHSLALFILFSVSLIGLVIVYRRKKIGYVIYLLGNISIVLFTVLFLGIKYFKEQISFAGKIIFSVISLYFLIGMFFLKNTKES